jgi:hypothetical protein
MGILYGWPKEYLLDHMSFGQIMLYLNEGMRFKYPPQPKSTDGSLVGASAEEIRRRRDELRRKYGSVSEG